MDIIIRYLLVILVMVCMIFPSISYEGDYLYLDKQGKVKGWYDLDTNTTFDKHNRPTGIIYDFDRVEMIAGSMNPKLLLSALSLSYYLQSVQPLIEA